MNSSPRLWEFPDRPFWQKRSDEIELPKQGAHVWISDLQNNVIAREHVSSEERSRALNMIPKSRQREFLISRHWLRTIIAKYLNVPGAEQIQIEISASKKPFLSEFSHVHFNLSHSYQFVAIAIARRPVGIDIEKVRSVPDCSNLATGLLHEQTIHQLNTANIENQSQLFLNAFTEREAFVKCLGDSLIPHPDWLNRFSPTSCKKSHQIVALPEIPGYVGNLCCCMTHT